MIAPDTSPEAIAALLDGVTPGPWTPHRDPCHFDTMSDVRGGAKRDVKGISSQLMVSVGGFAEWKEQEANTLFIAAARELVPALAAERDRLQSELWALQESHSALEGERNNLRAENERLRAALEEISKEVFYPPGFDRDAEPTRAAKIARSAIKGETP